MLADVVLVLLHYSLQLFILERQLQQRLQLAANPLEQLQCC